MNDSAIPAPDAASFVSAVSLTSDGVVRLDRDCAAGGRGWTHPETVVDRVAPDEQRRQGGIRARVGARGVAFDLEVGDPAAPVVDGRARGEPERGRGLDRRAGRRSRRPTRARRARRWCPRRVPAVNCGHGLEQDGAGRRGDRGAALDRDRRARVRHERVERVRRDGRVAVTETEAAESAAPSIVTTRLGAVCAEAGRLAVQTGTRQLRTPERSHPRPSRRPLRITLPRRRERRAVEDDHLGVHGDSRRYAEVDRAGDRDLVTAPRRR